MCEKTDTYRVMFYKYKVYTLGGTIMQKNAKQHLQDVSGQLQSAQGCLNQALSTVEKPENKQKKTKKSLHNKILIELLHVSKKQKDEAANGWLVTKGWPNKVSL